MSVGRRLGKAAKSIDKRFGLLAWLRGEPRPPSGGFDLEGEKLLDWAWICSKLPRGRKRALDIGCGQSPIVPTMLALGYRVVAVDPWDAELPKQIQGFTFIEGDFNAVELMPEFDVVVACSTIEHIGLSGRYGSKEDPDGDLKAMRKVVSLLAPDGLVFLTVPLGRDAVYEPWHRVYGRQRLPQLLDGYNIIESRYFAKEPWKPWQETTEDGAVDFPATLQRYALGEMILRKKNQSP